MAYHTTALHIEHLSSSATPSLPHSLTPPLSVIRNEEAKCRLGESPVWCARRRKLFWVDIAGKQLLSAHLEDKVL